MSQGTCFVQGNVPMKTSFHITSSMKLSQITRAHIDFCLPWVQSGHWVIYFTVDSPTFSKSSLPSKMLSPSGILPLDPQNHKQKSLEFVFSDWLKNTVNAHDESDQIETQEEMKDKAPSLHQAPSPHWLIHLELITTAALCGRKLRWSAAK